ncbi:MAG: carboxymuconolactone decarboxylase family protein [Acidobacteria bacterium]|nr:carboxymuconolactone decarboxylase family protein [Acidobacteriota bacterium]
MRFRIPTLGALLAAAMLAAPALTGEAIQESRANSGSPAVQRVDPFTPLTAPRIPPLDPSSLTPAQQAVTGPQGGSTQLRICLHNLEMCRQYWAFTRHLGFNYTLPLRDKELLILRTAWLSRGDFIWGVHGSGGGQRAGITDDELLRIPRGPAAGGWSDFDAALLRAADELHASRFITDATWATLAERYDEAQLLEVIFVVGNYTLLAMYHNSVGVPLEPGVPGLPQ